MNFASRAGLIEDDATAGEILSLAAQRGRGFNMDEFRAVVFQKFARSGATAEDVLSLIVSALPEHEKKIYSTILKNLLTSFSKRRKDPLLRHWELPHKRRSDPGQVPKCPFFIFKLKASAEKAQVSWWMKKYPWFPAERAGSKALRVARLSFGRGDLRLEQAGQGNQPGALSYYTDLTYTGWPRPKEGIIKEGSSVPHKEVAVIKRLPSGKGISIMSYVNNLGVKLHDILFVLHCQSAAVDLSFTEQEFFVSSQFTGETLYARAGLNFIDITVPLENLIKKIYLMYKEEDGKKKGIHDMRNYITRRGRS